MITVQTEDTKLQKLALKLHKDYAPKINETRSKNKFFFQLKTSAKQLINLYLYLF